LMIKGFFNFGGEGGIQTLGRLTPTPDFESGTFDHSATSPVQWFERAIIAVNRGFWLAVHAIVR
jgi:hypothetical protein